LDLVILSHPHADHLNGLTDVFEVYQVKQFATEALENNSDGFRALQDAVKAEGIDWQTLSASDRVRIPDGVSLRVIGPTQDYVNQTAVGGTFISSSEFASLEVLVSYKEFDMLLTGDSQQEQLSEAITATKVPDIEVLQVPHHGSKTGLTSEILTRLKPNIATISVGKNNYGHPNPHIVSLLEQAKIVIYRTDKRGDLRLISDGKTYNIE